jgi:hypothetical protein
MLDSLRGQLRAQGVVDEHIHAEEFGFAKIGRRRADEPEDLAPGAFALDRKLLASLAGVAFAGPALALVVVVGSYLVGGR